MTLFSLIKDLRKHVWDMQRILRSGLFDPKDYRQANRLTQLSAQRTLWHWTRHGYAEGRTAGTRPLSAWLLPKVTSGEITAQQGRLSTKLKTRSEIVDFCQQTRQNIAEYDTLCAIMDSEFDHAAQLLNKTDGLFYLRALHKSLRTIPLSDDLPMCLKKMESDPDLVLETLSALDQMRYVDIACAAGISWERQVKLKGRINRWDTVLIETVFRLEADRQESADGARYPIGELLRAALENDTRTEVFQQFRKDGAGLKIEDASFGDTPRQLLILVPATNVWLALSQAERSMYDAFRQIVEACLEQDVVLIPVMPVFTRDITDVKLPPLPLISYHTYAADRPDMLHYKETSLKGLFAFDRCGYNGASEWATGAPVTLCGVPETTKRDAIAARYRDEGLTKYSSDEAATGEDLPERFVFLPLQVTDDSVRRWQFLTALEVLETLTEWAENASAPLVLKRHPFDGSPLTTLALNRISDKKNILLTTMPIQTVLEKASCVVTANSGVGFEALLYDKPVIATGLSEYARATHLCETPLKLLETLSALESANFEHDPDRANAFLAQYFSDHTFEVSPTASLLGDNSPPIFHAFLDQVF